jgi:hypothetical protein
MPFAGWSCWRRVVWLGRPAPLTQAERDEVFLLIEAGDRTVAEQLHDRRLREGVRDAG